MDGTFNPHGMLLVNYFLFLSPPSFMPSLELGPVHSAHFPQPGVVLATPTAVQSEPPCAAPVPGTSQGRDHKDTEWRLCPGGAGSCQVLSPGHQHLLCFYDWVRPSAPLWIWPPFWKALWDPPGWKVYGYRFILVVITDTSIDHHQLLSVSALQHPTEIVTFHGLWCSSFMDPFSEALKGREFSKTPWKNIFFFSSFVNSKLWAVVIP